MVDTHEPAGTSEPEYAVPEYAELAQLLLDEEALVRAVAGGGLRHQPDPPFQRLELRYVDLKAGRHLQVQAFDDTQAHTTNYRGDDARGEVQRLLAEPYGHWHVESTTGTVAIRVTKKGRALVQRSAGSRVVQPDRSHDRTKQRWLAESDPLFAVLGITDADGVVKPARRDKLTQVQNFVAALDPVLQRAADAADDGPLRVVDLGCGNAYLTFAGYRYLAAVKEQQVAITGVDSKAQSRQHNTSVAERLGAADVFEFVQGTIDGVHLERAPHLVMALHACDTATDDALGRAVEWRAPVVLAAPCCHHDLHAQLQQSTVPAPYRLVTRHGILRQRLADVLTDALRASLLRLVGYRVEVIEFVDSVHTPRNALIRAVRTEAAPAHDDVAAYVELRDSWQVRPRLEDLLSDRLPRGVRR